MSIKFLPDIEDLAEGLGITGIAALLLLPVFAPVISGVGKPITKAVIKSAILFYESNKGAIAEMNDTWQDMVAEARTELAERPLKSAQPTE
ncbi:DUF5132 domain-containing protein [Nostoc sp. UHCC 0251]|uniref:DUF5132 domain-containing protein n=1 Tax=Nostoc sp. UHCC 0251 TaxID=3110240 RepID=UPI002B21BFE2|nr:DUF5132 domain-containing protein [Nostoc sp. UHCC 0251]MEA5624386.1 DUF5132 domain-containing protein [Nostoc sp. UHCC 0251]